MSDTTTNIVCELRTKTGSRDARRLRFDGRTVGCLQAAGETPHTDLHFDAKEFETARRKHVHVFELEFSGQSQSAVVNSLQWDSLGDSLLHVEFRPVVRGVAIDSKVEVHYLGVAAGIVQHIHDEVLIRCIPANIPDFLVARIDGLPEGTHILAKDLILPEGVELAEKPETEIAVISGLRFEAEPEPVDGETPPPSV